MLSEWGAGCYINAVEPGMVDEVNREASVQISDRGAPRYEAYEVASPCVKCACTPAGTTLLACQQPSSSFRGLLLWLPPFPSKLRETFPPPTFPGGCHAPCKRGDPPLSQTPGCQFASSSDASDMGRTRSSSSCPTRAEVGCWVVDGDCQPFPTPT